MFIRFVHKWSPNDPIAMTFACILNSTALGILLGNLGGSELQKLTLKEPLM